MANQQTPEPSDEYQLYCANVGHLFTAFARLETTLTGSLKLHLAINIEKPGTPRAMKLASAIYGSMRYKASRDAIKRILTAESASKGLVAYIEGVFAHVGHIENFRDKIAHQTVSAAHNGKDGFWQVSDVVNTRDLVKTQVWAFNTSAVGAAANDLFLAESIIGNRPVKEKTFDGLTDLSPPPWQYKPSMLKSVPQSRLIAPPPP